MKISIMSSRSFSCLFAWVSVTLVFAGMVLCAAILNAVGDA
jgi:hypothetical protein